MGTSRAFLAIVPPRAVLDAVGKVAWRAAHRPAELALPRLLSPRWTTREQWHLTLQFLGSHVDLDAAADALSSVRGAPARVRLGGIGGFPNARRATVVWVGVTEGARELAQLAASVGEAMAPVVGATGDDARGGSRGAARAFHAHLTLARLGRLADLRAAEESRACARVGPSWIAESLVLFESVTAAEGARYRPHAEVAL
ncbi:MAG TPA: RNA 2',3'-cyclic phosphodiesterase [Acidimicrobiia bacterium]